MDKLAISVRDGVFDAFVAMPASFPAPVVVVLHEVFGVNNDMRESCRELARQGFVAIAPDLFWRQERGVDFNHWSEEEWRRGLALYEAFDLDKGVQDVASTIAAASALKESSGKVGVMGYCLGGLLVYLTAARHTTAAAVAYYGGETEKYLAEAGDVHTPLLMHLGEEDEFISKAAQAEIKGAFSGNTHVEIHAYPGQSHAFPRHTGSHYDKASAELANSRTYSFFKRHLA